MKEIFRFLQALWEKGDVREIRVFDNKTGYPACGYFDCPDIATRALKEILHTHKVYITMNPLKRECLNRVPNQMRFRAGLKYSGDECVEKIKYILIDLDPKRASNTNATDEQLEQAEELAKKISEDYGKPFIYALSGNGYHLIYKVENGTNKDQIKAMLKKLDEKYTNEKVSVDTAVFNPSRITKIIGTWAKKGFSTKNKPHRISKLIAVNRDSLSIDMPEDIKQIKEVVYEEPTAPFVPKKGEFNLEEFIYQNNIKLCSVKDVSNKRIYGLRNCVFNPKHKNNDAAIFQYNNGMITYKCFHNSCEGKTWHDYKNALGIAEKKDYCKYCGVEVNWENGKPQNLDGTRHINCPEYLKHVEQEKEKQKKEDPAIKLARRKLAKNKENFEQIQKNNAEQKQDHEKTRAPKIEESNVEIEPDFEGREIEHEINLQKKEENLPIDDNKDAQKIDKEESPKPKNTATKKETPKKLTKKKLQEKAVEIKKQRASQKESNRVGNFVISEKGVFLENVEVDKDTGEAHFTYQKVFNQDVRLIEILNDITNDNTYAKLKWNCKKEVLVPTSVLIQSRNHHKLSEKGIWACSNNSKNISNYFMSRLEEIGTDETILSSQNGWIKDDFVLGNTLITKENKIKEIEFNGKGYHPESKGTEEKQMKVLKILSQDLQIATTLGAGAISPLVSALGCENFSYHLYGGSSRGKTTAARAALSLWGKSRSLIQDWSSSEAGREMLYQVSNGLPVVLQESQNQEDKVVSKEVYKFCNGKAYVKCNYANGKKEMMGIENIVGVLISNGEAQIGSSSQYEGDKARIIEQHKNKINENGYAQKIEKLLATLEKNYGHLGQKIIECWNKNSEKIKENYKLYTEQFRKIASQGIQYRQCPYYAACLVGCDILRNLGVEMPSTKELMSSFIETMEDKPLSLTERAFEHIVSNINSNENKFAKIEKNHQNGATWTIDDVTHDKWGYLDNVNNMAYIFPSIFNNVVNEGKFQKSSVFSSLKEDKKIVFEKGRNTKRVRIPGEKNQKTVVCIILEDDKKPPKETKKEKSKIDKKMDFDGKKTCLNCQVDIVQYEGVWREKNGKNSTPHNCDHYFNGVQMTVDNQYESEN